LAGIAMALGCGLAPAGCGRKAVPTPPVRTDIVARVDRVVITTHDFITESERQHAAPQAVADPATFLQRLVDREALVSLALSRGVQRDPELCRQYENMLIGALRERLLTPRLAELTVTDDEALAHYEANQGRYRVAGSLRLAVLRLQSRPGQQDQVKAQLEAVRQQLSTSAEPAVGFGVLAIANSDHQSSRYQGGDIGWLRDGKGPTWLSADVIAAAWQLSTPGQLSAVIADERAVFLLRLLERKDGGTRPLADVSAAIKADVLSAKRRETEEAFLREARQAAVITVQQPALAEAARQLRQRATAASPEPQAPPMP
jgi:hypothetical protein